MTQNIDELFDEAVEEQIVDIDVSDEAFDRDLTAYRTLRDERDDLKKQLTVNNEALEAVEARILYIANARGITQIRKEGVGLISVVPDPYPKVLNVEALIEWLDDNGHGGIAKRTVNFNTLRAWVKEQKENSNELPPPTVLEDKAGQTLRLKRA